MKRIERIISIYRDEEQKATIKMVASQKKYDQQLRMYNELMQYSSEYKKNYSLSAENGISAGFIINYNNFMARLRQTIDQQSLNLDAAQRSLDAAIINWQTQRKKQTILEKLNIKLDKKRHYTDMQREQKALDDTISAKYHHTRHER